jgi:hypothetical protein
LVSAIAPASSNLRRFRHQQQLSHRSCDLSLKHDQHSECIVCLPSLLTWFYPPHPPPPHTHTNIHTYWTIERYI